MTETPAQNLCAEYNVPSNDTPVTQSGDYLIAKRSPGDAWEQSGDIWYVSLTEPSFALACVRHNGKRAKNKFAFKLVSDALNASRALGHRVSAPDNLLAHKCTLKLHGSRVFITVPALNNEATPEGFYTEKTSFEKFLGSYRPPRPPSDLFLIRAVCQGNIFLGWYVCTDTGEWCFSSASAVKNVLQSRGMSKTEAEREMGRLAISPWKKVIKPWQPIELPNKEWNMDAPQFRYTPIAGEHPTWTKVLNDLGKNLNPYIKGGDYLLSWIAAAVQFPFEQSTYLAFVGAENCGKSTFHEALNLLFDNALTQADAILAGDDHFNGELENKIFCYIEETDLSKSPKAHAKCKNYVTAKSLMIRRLYMNGYGAPNSTHWIQCANDINYLPVFPKHDTRITVIKVDPLENKIPKPKLFEQLKAEAPAFSYTLLNYNIPKSKDRLIVPPIETEHKKRLADSNRDEFVSLIEDFIGDFKGTAEELHTYLVDKTGDSLFGFPRQFRSLWNKLEKHQCQLPKHTWERIDNGHKATKIQIRAASNMCA